MFLPDQRGDGLTLVVLDPMLQVVNGDQSFDRHGVCFAPECLDMNTWHAHIAGVRLRDLSAGGSRSSIDILH